MLPSLKSFLLENKFWVISLFFSAVIILGLGYGYYVFFAVTKDFPVNKSFVVEENESLRSISNRLEKEHYINSALGFRVWASFIGGDRYIQLGGYVFDSPQSLGSILKKLVLSKPDAPLIKVTIPEGSTVKDIAESVNKVLPSIEVKSFENVVIESKAEGKLFPSTYFLLPSMIDKRVVDLMVSTFEEKYLESFKNKQIPSPLQNKEEILSLAAILEGEAKTKEDMKMVAGILLKRLNIGMALQVDVAPETYKNKGLPEVPINNPGLIAIDAVFNFTDTPYLYYITGKDGKMYYAKTFTEHKLNIKKYLK